MTQQVLRKKSELDNLFDRINSYYANIKSTIEKDPKKFLETEITRNECC